MIGREREIAAVSAFLDSIPRGPQALLLEGEAGIGKSTVWFEAVRLAEASRVSCAEGSAGGERGQALLRGARGHRRPCVRRDASRAARAAGACARSHAAARRDGRASRPAHDGDGAGRRARRARPRAAGARGDRRRAVGGFRVASARSSSRHAGFPRSWGCSLARRTEGEDEAPLDLDRALPAGPAEARRPRSALARVAASHRQRPARQLAHAPDARADRAGLRRQPVLRARDRPGAGRRGGRVRRAAAAAGAAQRADACGRAGQRAVRRRAGGRARGGVAVAAHDRDGRRRACGRARRRCRRSSRPRRRACSSPSRAASGSRTRCSRPRCTAPRQTRGAGSSIADWLRSSPMTEERARHLAQSATRGRRADGVHGRAGRAAGRPARRVRRRGGAVRCRLPAHAGRRR